jgi:hypothetical protein
MRIYTLLLIAMLSIITCATYAQTPGYMGKRFIAKIELLTTPTFYKLNDINEYEKYEDITSINAIGLSVTPSIGIEYVLSKGVSAGVALRANSLKMPMNFYIKDEYYDYDISEYFISGYLGEVKLKSKMTSLYFKFHPHQKRGSIAPIGRYHQLEFIFGGTTFVTGKTVLTDPSDPAAQLETLDEFNYTLYDDVSEMEYEDRMPIQMLKYAFGYETVLKDKIPLEMSMQFAASISEGIYGFTGNKPQGITESEINFYNEIESRFNRSMNLTINIGLGYLVF